MAEPGGLILRYARALDRLDAPLLRSLFHDDARIEMGAIYSGGVDGFVEVAMGFMRAMAATRHEVSNLLVEERQAGLAVGESYVRAWHRIETPEGTRELVVLGRYLNRFESRGGEWRIGWHCELIDWGEERGVDPGWFDGSAELEKGRRDREDASYRLLG